MAFYLYFITDGMLRGLMPINSIWKTVFANYIVFQHLDIVFFLSYDVMPDVDIMSYIKANNKLAVNLNKRSVIILLKTK